MGDEEFRKFVSLVERPHDRLLFDPEKGTVGDGCSGRHAQSLTRNAALTKEIIPAKDADDGFLALFRHDRKLHPSFLDAVHSVRLFPLRENDAFLGILQNCFANTDVGEERLEMDRSRFLGRHNLLLDSELRRLPGW